MTRTQPETSTPTAKLTLTNYKHLFAKQARAFYMRLQFGLSRHVQYEGTYYQKEYNQTEVAVCPYVTPNATLSIMITITAIFSSGCT